MLCILQPLAFSFRMSNVEKQDVQDLRAQQFCQRDEHSITQQSQTHLEWNTRAKKEAQI